MNFYVYLHRKATTGEVFYVGKGAGRRAWEGRSRSPGWRNTASKHGLIVEIVQDGLQEWYAHELECELIALHGRRDLGHGPLVNLTDGGDGVFGFCWTEDAKQRLKEASSRPETIAKRSAAISAAFSTPEARARMAESARQSMSLPGRKEKHSIAVKAAVSRPEYKAKRAATVAKEEVRVKFSDKMKAAMANPELKGAMVTSMKKSIRALQARPVICVELNKKFDAIADAVAWLRSSVNPRAVGTPICSCCSGKYSSAYGYKWRYAEGAM